MKVYITIFFLLSYLHSNGQKIEYRNDSLFINGNNIDPMISKLKLDSILGIKGKEKHQSGKYKPGTKELINWIKYSYNNLGLIFSRNDYEKNKLSISIKLHENSNHEIDKSNMKTKVFKGELYLFETYMNNISTIEEMRVIKNSVIRYSEGTFLSKTGIVNGTIKYREMEVYLSFDFQTNQLTILNFSI